ncbi:hypothetical protein H920_01370 [Fukomys damarensis]|uniref:Uncharacterized protein n=1 Tax=Fukomys damarensis TaxID=885580 RepID=A0A091E3X5_FUKDA|nr:hypothetical protein H920_01370 [Fukomys damarensis]
MVSQQLEEKYFKQEELPTASETVKKIGKMETTRPLVELSLEVSADSGERDGDPRELYCMAGSSRSPTVLHGARLASTSLAPLCLPPSAPPRPQNFRWREQPSANNKFSIYFRKRNVCVLSKASPIENSFYSAMTVALPSPKAQVFLLDPYEVPSIFPLCILGVSLASRHADHHHIFHAFMDLTSCGSSEGRVASLMVLLFYTGYRNPFCRALLDLLSDQQPLLLFPNFERIHGNLKRKERYACDCRAFPKAISHACLRPHSQTEAGPSLARSLLGRCPVSHAILHAWVGISLPELSGAV